jgi:hypothetical protein
LDPLHKWTVCVGTPYATDQWQFGDATEMNGCFKMALTKAKEELTRHNVDSFQKVAFTTTDVVPLLNKAWASSFADPSKGRKALADRGWNPLNRALLTTEKILKTKTTVDATIATVVTPLPQDFDLNVDNGAAGDILDKLFTRRDNAKALGRSRAKKRHNEVHGGQVKKAKKMTAGAHVRDGQFLLDDDLKDFQAKYYAAKQDEAKQKQAKKQSAVEKQWQDAQVVKSKPFQQWTISDFKVMLQYRKKVGDPAMATTLTGLKEQWQQRCDNPSPAKPSPMPALKNGPSVTGATLKLLLDAAAATDEADGDADIEVETINAAAAV